MPRTLKIKSISFPENHPIPVRFTGEGEDVSPALKWSGVPDGTKEFVLIVEDPDAPSERPFAHWLLYNISSNTTQLPEGLIPTARLSYPILADQGTNDFGIMGYNGPMPPVGDPPHRYFFKLYALNSELGLRPGLSRDDLLKAISGHILDQTEFMATYERAAKKSA